MQRAYYQNSITNFIKDSVDEIIGKLSSNHANRTLTDLQKNAWIQQIKILKRQLMSFKGYIFFEFSIPRMGKRVDNIVIINDCVFVIEFKVGSSKFDTYSEIQTIDYALDLKNFHEGSHNAKLIPILISTEADNPSVSTDSVLSLETAAKTNKTELSNTLNHFLTSSSNSIDPVLWSNTAYKPTPTIVEAAQALYKGHNVEEISRSDASAINLSTTADCLNRIISNSKLKNEKTICFITGVPGAGKTLAGLNIANQRMKSNEDEHALFLSGNGPLVDVLREALARDIVSNPHSSEIIKKSEALRNTSAFIQNIHHFRDEYLKNKDKPIERVVVFDEAQRAWNQKQVQAFMRRKRGIENFSMSEPEFLIEVMDRHSDWCVIVCLIGGGQEINTGEAGLSEWVSAILKKHPNWKVHYSDLIINSSNYLNSSTLKKWLINHAKAESELHLAVSLRSYRSEKLSEFVHALLNLERSKASILYQEIQPRFPIYITRNLDKAKQWLKSKRKGTERAGIVASSGARRLRTENINVKNEILPANWFLNPSCDIRSSDFLEEIATEFDIQGLEIDWACVAWGANFYYASNKWHYRNFKGTKWQNIN